MGKRSSCGSAKNRKLQNPVIWSQNQGENSTMMEWTNDQIITLSAACTQWNNVNMFDFPTMLSRSSVACFSCSWDALIINTVSVKVWHTPLLPSSFPFPFPSSSAMPMLQFKEFVTPCSWAKIVPVEACSKENCFMKASRASGRTKSTKQIKPH